MKSAAELGIDEGVASTFGSENPGCSAEKIAVGMLHSGKFLSGDWVSGNKAAQRFASEKMRGFDGDLLLRAAYVGDE